MRDQLRVGEEVRRVDSGSIGARWDLVSNLPKLVFELDTCNKMRHHEKMQFSQNDSFRLLLRTRHLLMMRNKILAAAYRFGAVVKFSTRSK